HQGGSMNGILNKLFIIIALAAFTGTLCAEETSPSVFSQKPASRFGRGVINIVSSPLELPAQMYTRSVYYEENHDNPFATLGGFVEGIPMGILVYFPWRLGAGLYDFFTFPFSRCDPCIISPAYVSFSPDFLEKK
ncbi:MAG: hypothetical protein WCQ99_10510, partial [Pseudomonadota bacterium]